VTQDGERGIAGVEVLVKAKVAFGRVGLGWRSGEERQQQGDGERSLASARGQAWHPQADCRKATDWMPATSNRLRQRTFWQATMSSRRTI